MGMEWSILWGRGVKCLKKTAGSSGIERFSEIILGEEKYNLQLFYSRNHPGLCCILTCLDFIRLTDTRARTLEPPCAIVLSVSTWNYPKHIKPLPKYSVTIISPQFHKGPKRHSAKRNYKHFAEGFTQCPVDGNASHHSGNSSFILL